MLAIPQAGYVGFPILPDGSIPTYHRFESRQQAYWWWQNQSKITTAKIFLNGVEQNPEKWKYKGRVDPFPSYNPGTHSHPGDYLPPKRGRALRRTRGQKPH